MLSKQIDKYFSNFQNFFFYYKDGFFEFPYTANSPEAIIKSLDKVPFVKHSKKKEVFSSNNPFVKMVTQYQEIEDGLWLMVAKSEYKKNINYKRIVDKKLPSDYYLLCLEISTTEIKAKPSLVNGFSYSNYSWLLFKPKSSLNHCRFKGSKQASVSVFFSEKWLKNILYKNQRFLNSNLRKFFESNAQHIFWPDTHEVLEFIHKPFLDIFIKKSESGISDLVTFKKKAHDFIFLFIDKYNQEKIGENFFEISDNDRKKILNAQRLLIENISSPFIGIENLAKEVGVSPTKLKSNFKLVFGEAVFQYYRQKQMEYAKSVLQENKISVKEIANELGYENTSKFTAAFKKHMGNLPSEVK